MKSAYELAMERLNKTAPTVKLSNEQKKRLPNWNLNMAPGSPRAELPSRVKWPAWQMI
jgi:hypothetical protein